MAYVLRKSLDHPDEVVAFPNLHVDLVHIGDVTVGRLTTEPGWRWSKDVKPTVGGDWCQVRHVGVVISGRLGLDFPDGSSAVLGPGDVFDIPPGHDGYTVGDEPIVQIEWSGLRHWAGLGGARSRVLLTVLFEWGVAVHDIDFQAVRAGEKSWSEVRKDLKGISGKARAQITKDYLG